MQILKAVIFIGLLACALAVYDPYGVYAPAVAAYDVASPLYADYGYGPGYGPGYGYGLGYGLGGYNYGLGGYYLKK